MSRNRMFSLGLAVLLGTAVAGVPTAPAAQTAQAAQATQATQPAGGMTGGEEYEIPGWFTQSFLEIPEDAAEAAEADRHAMLFIHSDE